MQSEPKTTRFKSGPRGVCTFTMQIYAINLLAAATLGGAYNAGRESPLGLQVVTDRISATATVSAPKLRQKSISAPAFG